MNIFHTYLETKISDSHSPTNFPVTHMREMHPKHALITAPFSRLLGELQTHFPLACVALPRSSAVSQTFAQAQTVMTEAINVVMRVWRPKCYFLQGLSHISENIKSKQNSAFFFFLSPNSWTLKISYIGGRQWKQIDKRGAEESTWKFPVWMIIVNMLRKEVKNCVQYNFFYTAKFYCNELEFL